MNDIQIRRADVNDCELIATLLSYLAKEIGGTQSFLSTPEAIKRYGFGNNPMFHCLIAERENQAVGLSLFFPVFSTNRGQPGVYVQDLWISKMLRGQGLGRNLIRETISFSLKSWNASYLSLMVYSHNSKAKMFYNNLGFDTREEDVSMVLEGEAYFNLGGNL